MPRQKDRSPNHRTEALVTLKAYQTGPPSSSTVMLMAMNPHNALKTFPSESYPENLSRQLCSDGPRH